MKFDLAQNRPRKGPEIANDIWFTLYLGYGVYRKKEIIKNEFILEYCGELMTGKQGRI